jgi:hypothetical protein
VFFVVVSRIVTKITGHQPGLEYDGKSEPKGEIHHA